MSELLIPALLPDSRPIASALLLPAYGLSASPVGSGIGEPGSFSGGTDEWIFSFNEEGVTPSKIEWLGQDFSAAVKQQEIDDVLNAQLVADGLSLTFKVPPLAPSGTNGTQGSLSAPKQSVVEHYLSLADMTRSVMHGTASDELPTFTSAGHHRHDSALDTLFKVFDKGEVGVLKPGQSPAVQSLAWVLDHLDVLKSQGVAGLVVDELQDVDAHNAPIIMGLLDDIEINGLPLCIVQQEPAQLLQINSLHDLIAKKERIPFIVSGLMHINQRKSPPVVRPAVLQSFPQTAHAAPARRAARPAAAHWHDTLPSGRLVVSAQASDKVSKIFRLKLAGLAVPQIAQILSKTGVAKFDLTDPTAYHNDAQLWSRAVVVDVLYSSRVDVDAGAGMVASPDFANNGDASLADVSTDVDEHMQCLVRLPHAAPSGDAKTRMATAALDTKSILAEALLGQLFCGCPAHQPLVLREMSRQSNLGFSLSPRRACGCATLTFERQELTACLHAAMTALVKTAPSDGGFLSMVQTELAELVSHGSDAVQNARWDQQKKNNLSVIDVGIGVLSRKLGWLSDAQISDRVQAFTALLGKELLDQSEAAHFFALTQALVASLYLNLHTGWLKLYWSHSLVPVDIRLTDRENQRQGLTLRHVLR